MGDNLEAVDNRTTFSCPYRPEKVRKVFAIHVVPRGGRPPLPSEEKKDAYALRQQFIPLGLDSSGYFVIGNDCAECRSCVPLRIRARDYPFRKSAKEIIERNTDLAVYTKPVSLTAEHFALYQKYDRIRHPENAGIISDFATFEGVMKPHTHMVEMRRKSDNRLVAVAIIDAQIGFLNAHCDFYDPEESIGKRSLGTFCDLKLIQFAQELDIPYVYIGKWVQQSSKLFYKKNYQNLEALTDAGWVPFDPAVHINGPNLRRNIPATIPWKISF